MKAQRQQSAGKGAGKASTQGSAGKISSTHKRYGSVPAKVVQRKASGPTKDDQEGAAIAQRGVSEAAEPLPFFGAIQPLFGKHDVSSVRAHTGPVAGQAARSIGARAYTTGQDVAFDGKPDLHTAAHEAAHVVQQRAGVQLASVFGRAGDPHEQQADAVADRVVAGRSAEDLLDQMAPSSGAAATGLVQRKEIRTEGKVQGRAELQKILQSGSLPAVRAAHEALKRAPKRRTPPVILDTLSFGDGKDHWHIDVLDTDTDAMIPVFARQRRVLEAEDAGKPVSDEWTKFAERFNDKLKTVLHAFDLDAKGTETPKGKSIVAARLQFLFTDTQRRKLTSFFDTNVIPERLFNGDEVGRATAQQRIVIAGHILGTGKYKEGSFEQRLHAKMCYHFARLVWLYAGATPAGGQNTGVMGGFDHSGAAVFGGGEYESVFHAKRDSSLKVTEGTAQAEKHGNKATRFRMAPWSLVMEMQPGDWLYIYNANGSSTGAHSIIFGGWIGDEEKITTDGKTRHAREARVFDQGSPKAGGKSRTKLLGDDFFMHGSRAVNPVNQIWRADPDNAPITSADDLSPELTKAVSRANRGFVKKLSRKRANRGKELSPDLFRKWLKRDNAVHIIMLIGKQVLTDKQVAMLVEANGKDDLHDLVCLNQRVRPFAHNAQVLEDGREKQLEGTEKKKGVEEKFAESKADADAEVARIEAKIAQYLMEAMVAEIELMPLELGRDGLDKSDELKKLRTKFREVDAEKKKTKDKAKRKELAAKRKKLIEEIREVRGEHKSTKKQRRELTTRIRKLRTTASRAWRRMHSWESELDKVERGLPYAIAHGGPLRGKDDRSKVTGRYSALPESVPWNTIMVEKKLEPKKGK